MRNIFTIFFLVTSVYSFSQNGCLNNVNFGGLDICLPEFNNMSEVSTNREYKSILDNYSIGETLLGFYASENFLKQLKGEAICSNDCDSIKVYSTEFFKDKEISPDILELIFDEVLKKFQSDANELVNDVLKKADLQETISIENPIIIDVFDDSDSIKSFLMLSEVSNSEIGQNILQLSLLNMAIIENKLIYFAYYLNYDNADSVKNIKSKNLSFSKKLLTNYDKESKLGDYYFSDNHPKAKGLNFQIQPPSDFTQKEGVRPNIVQKWDKGLGMKLESFMVLVYKDESISEYSKEDYRTIFRNKDSREEFLSDIPFTILNSKYYVIDNYPGYILDGYQDIERTDIKARIYYIQSQVFIGEHSFNILFTTPNKDAVESRRDLFNKIANSVVFPDQYNY